LSRLQKKKQNRVLSHKADVIAIHQNFSNHWTMIKEIRKKLQELFKNTIIIEYLMGLQLSEDEFLY